VGAACGAVSKRCGTPRQRVGWQVHAHGMYCSCIPEMYEPHRHIFAPHIARAYTDQQNSQPVIYNIPGQSHQQGLFLLLYHVCQSAFTDPFHSHS